MQDADFGLEGEVVVEGIADRSGLAVGGGVVEAKGSVGLLLNFDDRGGTVPRRCAEPVENGEGTEEGKGRENPGAAAREDGKEVGEGPFGGRAGHVE